MVKPGYATAATGQTRQAIIAQARRPDRPGYFGAPALALEILDGKDNWQLPRFSREMAQSNLDLLLDRASLRHEARTRQRQDAWLKNSRRCRD